MNLLDFFRAIYQTAETEQNTYLWTLPGKTTYPFAATDLQGIANKAAELTAKRQNVYFGVGTSAGSLAFNERPKNTEITGITALWVDLDIASSAAHASDQLPPDIASAMQLLPYELPASIIVHSGYGLHAYWILREYWEFETEAEREQASILLKRIQGYVRTQASAKGWKVDATADLARVLRCPDTLNYKLPESPKQCQVIEFCDLRYSPSDFDILPEAIQAIPVGDNNRVERFERRATDGNANLMMSQCAFLRYCELNANKITYSEWVAALSNIVRASDGVDAAHKFSALDTKRYKAVDTESKINEVLQRMNPQGCNYIMTDLGFTGCPEGGCGVKAPCGWSLGKLPQAKAIINNIVNIDGDTVYQKHIIEALVTLEKSDKMTYNKFLEACRGRIDINNLKRTIRDYGKPAETPIDIPTQGVALAIGDKLGDVTTRKGVPDAPVDLALPPGFSFGENGIYYRTESRDGIPKFQRAAGVPVVITRRIFNIDTETEKMAIKFKYFNLWREIIQPKQNYFVARNITVLSNFGLNMTSETAKYMVRFLSELETVNKDRIPLEYAVSTMGWRGNFEQFLTPTDSKYIFDLEDGGEMTNAYVKRGTMKGWLETAAQVRKHPVARFVLATSFAAPLLKVFNHRNFMVYFWGTSGGGKTAAMVWALSAWGIANNMMVNFNLSMSGLEGRLALATDLPAGINERQAAGAGKDKQDFLERVVYMIEGGKGKARATPTGIRKTLSWRTIGLACGEEPLSRENTVQGVKTRLLELNIYPVLENELAKSLYTESEKNCGHAGPAFVERLIYEIANNKSELHSAYDNLQRALQTKFPEYFSVHIDAVALVCLADYLSSVWLFGMNPKQAEREAANMAAVIIRELPTKVQISDVERGWDFVKNWISSNALRFESNLNNKQIVSPLYGFYSSDMQNLCIYPEALTTAMQNVGLSVDKLLKEFANTGKILTEADGAKRRFKILTRHNGTRCRVIKIPIEILNAE